MKAEYDRAALEPAADEVWLDVIQRFPEMRRWVAHNKTVPEPILEVLAEDPDAEVRSSVAMKRKLSSELFARLAGDSEPHVRMRIALNQKVPEVILEMLAGDPDPDVAEAARERMGRVK